jgi:hypothetical protein
MTEPLLGVSLFRDVRPDQAGFQPSFLYVLVCVLAPALLGLLASALIGWLSKLVGRSKGEGGDDA